MKKPIAMLLCTAVLASGFAFAACSDTSKDDDKKPSKEEVEDEDEDKDEDEDSNDSDADAPSPDTVAGGYYQIFKDAIDNGGSIEDAADSLVTELSDYNLAMMHASEGYLDGLTDEVKGFSNGTTLKPMIGSIPFVIHIFESDDPAALKDSLLDMADPRWNICTEADETFCEVYGNYVFFAMVPNE